MRDLTPKERQQVKELVSMCANYDRPGRMCLLLDAEDAAADCPMLAVTTTDKVCSYFKAAVLPLNPLLEAVLCAKQVETKQCAMCGKAFAPKSNRQAYCGEKCQKKGKRDHDREWRRERRNMAG